MNELLSANKRRTCIGLSGAGPLRFRCCFKIETELSLFPRAYVSESVQYGNGSRPADHGSFRQIPSRYRKHLLGNTRKLLCNLAPKLGTCRPPFAST